MGVLELIVVILVLMWLLGYFGRGRIYYREPVTPAPWYAGNIWHTLLVIVVILIILRLLRIA
jgi:TM2 domain-containing membrane protein YozV